MATRQFALTHTLLDSVADATRRENFTLLHFTVDSPDFVMDCLFLFLNRQIPVVLQFTLQRQTG